MPSRLELLVDNVAKPELAENGAVKILIVPVKSVASSFVPSGVMAKAPLIELLTGIVKAMLA